MRQIKPTSKFNSAHQNMLSTVVSFALNASNLTTTQSIAAFFAIINALKLNLEEIIKIQGDINNPVTGISDQKEVIKNSLVQTSTLVMQTVYAFAVKKGDSELAKQMQMTSSKLARMKDNVFMGTVQAAIDNVKTVLPDLVAYNITETLVELWEENLGNFKAIVSDPKVAHDSIDVFKNKVQDLLRACIILLYNQADTIAVQFKAEKIDYYRGYRKARKLQPLVKHTKLRVLVTTELGVPVSR